MAQLLHKDLTCNIAGCNQPAVFVLQNCKGNACGNFCTAHGRARLRELQAIEDRQAELYETKAIPPLRAR